MISDQESRAQGIARFRDGDLEGWAMARTSWSQAWDEEEDDEPNGVDLGAGGPSLWEAELEALWEAEAEGRFEEIQTPIR